MNSHIAIAALLLCLFCLVASASLIRELQATPTKQAIIIEADDPKTLPSWIHVDFSDGVDG